MRRVAVKIAYLGKDFCGSQYQPEFRTVVGDILIDLQKIYEDVPPEWFDIKAAGRTDKGVSALGNVVTFYTNIDDDDSLMRALNFASKSVFYRSVATVDDHFNPRFANRRIYRYVLPSRRLDIEKVKKCAKLFVGTHDFIRFCKDDGRPTVMTIDSVTVEQDGENFILTFSAMYFLWNMIRKMCSAIAFVGRGLRTLQDVEDALNGKEINFGIARADALTLVDTVYDDLEFKEPSAKYYTKRVKEERFEEDLRREFFDSL